MKFYYICAKLYFGVQNRVVKCKQAEFSQVVHV